MPVILKHSFHSLTFINNYFIIFFNKEWYQVKVTKMTEIIEILNTIEGNVWMWWDYELLHDPNRYIDGDPR